MNRICLVVGVSFFFKYLFIFLLFLGSQEWASIIQWQLIGDEWVVISFDDRAISEIIICFSFPSDDWWLLIVVTHLRRDAVGACKSSATTTHTHTQTMSNHRHANAIKLHAKLVFKFIRIRNGIVNIMFWMPRQWCGVRTMVSRHLLALCLDYFLGLSIRFDLLSHLNRSL